MGGAPFPPGVLANVIPELPPMLTELMAVKELVVTVMFEIAAHATVAGALSCKIEAEVEPPPKLAGLEEVALSVRLVIWVVVAEENVSHTGAVTDRLVMMFEPPPPLRLTWEPFVLDPTMTFG